MSRIGRKPIEIPSTVNVAISPGRVQVNGPLGELDQVVPQRMKVEQADGALTVTRPTERGEDRALHGLTRIRNANKAMHDTAQMPTSRIKEEIARVLKDEGYIKDFRVVEVEGQPFSTLVVELKFGRNRQRVITGLKRVSRPGRRVYARKDRLPRVLGGLGTAILSTSNGLITSRQAAERGVGGEVIAFVW